MTKSTNDLKAETAASVYLQMRGYKIVERNWQRPRSKIDIIASKGGSIHFVEVKYRSNDDTFSDDVTISPSRLLQMQRSAWGWIDETKWQGGYVLSSVELAGPNFTVLGFIENVI
jgi:putative endonuclease